MLPFRVQGDEVVPHFLGENDHPWLRLLLDEHERFVGRPRRELQDRLTDPLAPGVAPDKQRLAAHVLHRCCGTQWRAEVPPRRARAALFVEAAGKDGPRDTIVVAAAEQLGVSAIALDTALFADLPGERVVAGPTQALSPTELALRANLALAQGLVFRASAVRIEVEGNARALVRHGKLRGLICRVARGPEGADAHMEVSGPYTLFRHTLVYGRALGDLLPILAWCRRFRLRAECALRGRKRTLRLATGDPIFPSAEPRRYDSRLEERFARDFSRLAPDWNVVREPEPVEACGTLIFPDFALHHRGDPSRRWLVEIVGFWTPEYLARKLVQYRAASLTNLILCIDADRCCQDGELPANALVIRFRRRVDAAEVLRVIGAARVLE